MAVFLVLAIVSLLLSVIFGLSIASSKSSSTPSSGRFGRVPQAHRTNGSGNMRSAGGSTEPSVDWVTGKRLR